MADLVILPAKHQAEIHQFVANFNSLLLSGETILPLTVQVFIFVYSGVDPNPNLVLVPGPSVINNIVSQGLQEGIVGVTYTITIQATTSLGNVYSMEAKLAILDNNYPAAGAFIYYYFTSQPYPFQVIETNHWSASVGGVQVFNTILNYSLSDTNSWSAAALLATVNDGTYTQNLSDTNSWVASISSAMVVNAVINYSLGETNHWAAAVVNAAVNTIVVNYSLPETNHWAATVQSATVM